VILIAAQILDLSVYYFQLSDRCISHYTGEAHCRFDRFATKAPEDGHFGQLNCRGSTVEVGPEVFW
jgi:hypothetical protein